MNNSLARCLVLLFACLFCLSVSSQAYKATKASSSRSAPAYRDAGKKANAAPNVTRAVEKDCLYPQKVYLLGKAMEGGPNGGTCDEQGYNCRVDEYGYRSVGKEEFRLQVSPYARVPSHDDKITGLHVPEGEEPPAISTYAKRGQVSYAIDLYAHSKNKWQVDVSFNREDGVGFWITMDKEVDTINLDTLSKLIDDIHRTRQQLPGVRQFPQSDSCRAKLAEFMNPK